MGQSGGKQANYDQKQIAEQYKLSESQVQTLVKAFQKEAPKGTIDKSRFVKIVGVVRNANPELAAFNDEILGLIFTFCDTDHSGKLDPFEVLAALSIFAQGEQEDKARLVFKTIDKDNSGVLTRDEIRAHARKVCAFSATLVKADIKGALKGVLGSITSAAIGAALGAMELQFVEDITRDIMTADTDKDGHVSLDEWLNAAKENNTIKALIDPNLSANAWRVVYGLENIDSNEKVILIQQSPKGFATIFDWELEEGKVSVLGKHTPPPPPPDIHVNIAAKKGEPTKMEVTVTSTTTTQDLLKLASQISDEALENIALVGPEGQVGDVRIQEVKVYESVKEGDTIQVVNYKSWKGHVDIKTLTGKSFKVECEAANTVMQIKEKIQDHEGIPVDQQRLIYRGRSLDDEHLLSHYVVLDGSPLHLVLRLRS